MEHLGTLRGADGSPRHLTLFVKDEQRPPRILCVIAMIDDDETDWKVLTIALDDDKAQNPGRRV